MQPPMPSGWGLLRVGHLRAGLLVRLRAEWKLWQPPSVQARAGQPTVQACRRVSPTQAQEGAVAPT